MKKIFNSAAVFLAAILLLLNLTSCVGNDDEESDTLLYGLGYHTIAEIYGYSYKGTVNSSSGKTLTPVITIYNDSRLDWNMSSTGMGNNQFYYYAEMVAINVYKTWWYTDKSKITSDTDRSEADMYVILAINSLSSITTEVMDAGTTGAGNSMAGTPLDMTRTSSYKNTTPTTVTDNSSLNTTITIPSAAVSAEWPETKTYSGSFIYIVASTSGDGETGDSSTPCVTVTKTDDNTVTVQNVRMHVSSPLEMTLMPFSVTEVSVKKYGDVYYLSKGSFSTQTSDYAESNGVKTSGYKISGSSLTGKLEDGVLTLKIVFKPGSMPLDINEIFTSSN